MQNRIKKLRVERGLRQKDVADKLGISPQSFGYYENWVNKPDPEMLCKIADLFEVSVDYLLGRENEDGTKMYTFEPETFSPAERKVIDKYRALSPENKKYLDTTLDFLCGKSEKR